MPLVQFGGAVSGIDTRALIDAIVNAEAGALRRVQQKRTDLEARQKAYGRLQTLLQDVLTKAKAFTVNRVGGSKLASSANETALTATATPSASAATYQVTVDRLATATKATSTASVGTAVTNAAQALSGLNLPGTVSAGNVSIAVNGTFVTAAIGDPATTTLQGALDAMASAIQAQVQATDAGATVTASVVGNRAQFAISGATTSHAVAFGAAGDTSNAAAILGLTTLGSQSLANGTPITGASALGVVRTTSTLDTAGLTGLTSTTTGSLTINGVAVSYNTSVDSLTDLISRINNSNAGVVASIDRTNDKLVVTNRTAGATAIRIEDTSGTLGAALKLAPGTTTAQVLGQQSRVYVDGREVTADSNKVSSAIDGVTLDLRAAGLGATTLTISADKTTTTDAVRAFVDAFNKLSDELETVTQNQPGKTKGVLAAEAGVRDLLFSLRQTALSTAAGYTGTYRALSDLGVTTGAIGTALGATKRLVLDETKLATAIDADPTRVADLLNQAGGVIAPLATRLDGLLATDGMIDATQDGMATELTRLSKRQSAIEDRLELRRQGLERRYASLEATLALLQSQGSAMSESAKNL